MNKRPVIRIVPKTNILAPSGLCFSKSDTLKMNKNISINDQMPLINIGSKLILFLIFTTILIYEIVAILLAIPNENTLLSF